MEKTLILQLVEAADNMREAQRAYFKSKKNYSPEMKKKLADAIAAEQHFDRILQQVKSQLMIEKMEGKVGGHQITIDPNLKPDTQDVMDKKRYEYSWGGINAGRSHAWQVCPVCNGQPNSHQRLMLGGTIQFGCTVCKGAGIISKVTGKPPENA